MVDRRNDEGRTQKVAEAAARGLGIRHLQIAVMSAAAFMAYVLRANLSIAIVAMVDSHDKNTTEPLAPTYDWDEKIQGYVLSSFFWGYMMTQIPAGLLTERFGGHRFLCAAILGSSVLSLVFTQCAYFGGWMLVCANRMLQGISQGFVFPSIFTLLGLWAPPSERSRLTSVSVSAQLLGTVASTPVSGFLCSAYGWPSVFYILGAIGTAVGIAMIFLGADSPSKHRMISEEEKQYIQKSLGGAKKKHRVPWKNVFTSIPYLAAIFTMAFQASVHLTFLTKIPTYMATVLKFSIQGNGILSAVPYLLSWVLTFVFSWTCDFLIGGGWLTRSTARKVFNSIANFGMAICLILLAHSDNTTVSVVLLTLAMGFTAGCFVGVQAGFIDLAPNFSGAIFSVSNFSSASLSVGGPILVGYIVTETGSSEQWRIVFYICSALLVFGNVVYLIWGTSETQWWNWPERYQSKFYYERRHGEEELEERYYVRKPSGAFL